MEVKNYKTRKWQDVTLEECLSHRDFDTDDVWQVAAVKNAIAYGDIAGDGLDVRCQHIDEVVTAWYATTNIHSIAQILFDFGWHVVINTTNRTIFIKGKEHASIEHCNFETAYLSVYYVESHNQYFDKDEDINSSIVNLEKILSNYGITDKGKVGSFIFTLKLNPSQSEYEIKMRVEKYLKDSKMDNYVIQHKDGTFLMCDNILPMIYSDIENLRGDFWPEDGDKILTEYQYWTNKY